MQSCTLKKINIDVSNYDVNSLFGTQAYDNTYSEVEIKVKSYTMFADSGTDVNANDKKALPEGVSVTETAGTSEA